MADAPVIPNIPAPAPAAAAAPPAPAPAPGSIPPVPAAVDFTAATAPWKVGEPWKIGDPAAPRDWWDAIPEAPVREHVAAHKYASPAELAMANYNLTKLQRGADDVVGLPKPDAPPEQWDAFYTKAGRPADAKGYDKVDFAVGLPQGMAVDDGLKTQAQNMFFAMGLNPSQAQKAMGEYNKMFVAQQAGIQEAQTTANNAAVDTLMGTWGDKAEEYKAQGRTVIAAIDPKGELIPKLDALLGAAPVMDLLIRIGNATKEGGFKPGGGGGGDPADPSNMTREQAQTAINALNNDPVFQKSYTTKGDPGHQAALDKMSKLYARI